MAQGSMFEALFVRALKPQGAFAEALRAVGYDPAHPKAEYPTRVWVDSLEVARVHTFAALPREAGYRALGRAFSDGFLLTLAGKIIAVTIPFLKPETALRNMPRYIRMGRSDLALELTVERGFARGVFRDPFCTPGDFLGGVLEVGLRKLNVEPKVAVVQRNPHEAELEVRW